jgi:hypothetical protein
LKSQYLINNRTGYAPKADKYSQLQLHALGEYTGRNISGNLGLVTVRGEGKMERARGEQHPLRAIASPSSSYLGWPATNVCICNGDILWQVPHSGEYSGLARSAPSDH